MRMRLYQTPLGIVCAPTVKDCRAILAIFGADPLVPVIPVKRARGVIFAVAGHIEPDAIDQHIHKFKWMGPDERRRELIKLRNLPADYGPLFGGQNGGHDDEGDSRSEGQERS